MTRTVASSRENADVRAWAAEQGIDLASGGRGRIPASVRAGYLAYRDGRDPAEPGGPPPTDDIDGDQGADQGAVDGQGEPGQPPVAEGGGDAPEGHPGERKPSLAGMTGAPVAGPAEPRRGLLGGRRPKVAGEGGGLRARVRRVSTERVVGLVWQLLAQGVAVDQRNVPVARMMALQAPAAGVMVDEVIRGTVVDRMLQPFARASERGDAVFALLGPPAIVALATRRPDLYPMLRPVLVSAVETWADIAGPRMAKQEDQRRKRASQVGSQEDIGAMVDALFAPIADAAAAEHAAA